LQTHINPSTSVPKGVLLVNLGTPDDPSTSSVRRYLKEFLSDPRVLDIGQVARTVLVNAVIAPFRSSRSAKSYREIWMKEGSPLLFYSKVLQRELSQTLGADWHVELAMRYQNPSIESALQRMKDRGIDHITVIPLFPHYASASTGSVQDKVMSLVSKWQVVPEIFFLKSFHDNLGMIKVFADHARKHNVASFDHVLFSFHGLPVRQLKKADPCGDWCKADKVCCETLNSCNKNCYSAQCYDTARLLAAELELDPGKFTVCFQSRLGRDPWVPPYTSEIVKKLALEGKKRVLAFCPAFVADCLETLFEVSVEYQEDFKAAGGELMQLVESLNGDPAWIDALSKMIKSRDTLPEVAFGQAAALKAALTN